jgi:hypothetical protein
MFWYGRLDVHRAAPLAPGLFAFMGAWASNKQSQDEYGWPTMSTKAAEKAAQLSVGEEKLDTLKAASKQVNSGLIEEKKSSGPKPKKSTSNLVPIASFVRIKPIIESDKKGGKITVEKHISGWDEENGGVEISGIKGGGSKVFDHMAAALPPEGKFMSLLMNLSFSCCTCSCC